MQSFLALLKNPAWDLALVLMLVAGGFFLGISGGKKKMAFIILAIYVLLALFPFLPLHIPANGMCLWRCSPTPIAPFAREFTVP